MATIILTDPMPKVPSTADVKIEAWRDEQRQHAEADPAFAAATKWGDAEGVDPTKSNGA